MNYRRCPFCGSGSLKPIAREPYNYNNARKHRYYIKCNSCNARGSLCNSPEDALKRWNGFTVDESPEGQTTLNDMIMEVQK